MFARLTAIQKSRLLLAIMLLFLYLAYQFSFVKAFDAIVLNHQLNKERNAVQEVDGSYPQLERKNHFYLTAVKGYEVKKADLENKLWQAISGMAIAKQVNISFSPNPVMANDTVSTGPAILTQQFAFKGDYFNLVQLLDTLSKSKGIGKISSMALSIPKADENGKLLMKIDLVGIAK